ncbi:hypothetical protein AMECASPLE_038743 [Ameca splendens]|uniref:Uncharacterized protein n=1 Tax=Ameca splendens TaxID=208324 RepID=A0ABV0Y901_9TELE
MNDCWVLEQQIIKFVPHDQRDCSHFWIQLEECLLASKETTQACCVPPSGFLGDPCGRGCHVGTRRFCSQSDVRGISYDSSSSWDGLGENLCDTESCRKVHTGLCVYCTESMFIHAVTHGNKDIENKNV